MEVPPNLQPSLQVRLLDNPELAVMLEAEVKKLSKLLLDLDPFGNNFMKNYAPLWSRRKALEDLRAEIIKRTQL